MTTTAAAPYVSLVRAGRGGFADALRAEWTKLWSVRGWAASLVSTALLVVLVGLLGASGGPNPCGGGPQCAPPLGPDGEAVNDGSYFVRQTLVGDGSLTVRVTTLTGLVPVLDGGPDDGLDMTDGLVPWAKAGIMIRASADPGSSYAAIMVTAAHGVRMQYDYTHDIAGSAATVSKSSPRWLRLTRVGDTVTGYESADGAAWSVVGAAKLTGLPSSVPAGMFVASPHLDVVTQRPGALSSIGGPSQATAAFDQIELASGSPSSGNGTGDLWTGNEPEAGPGSSPTQIGFQRAGDTFTVTGTGDVGPGVAGPEGNTVERSLLGAFAGLIAVIVVGTMFITTEYRRGLIRTTFAADPRRGRVFAAKVVVLGGATFVVALLGSAFAMWFVNGVRRRSGEFILPVPWPTEVRVVVGTAALLALAAVLALALGTILRRSAGAVATALVLIVLPYLLAIASVLPTAPAEWLLLITPAAAFAIQQSTPAYEQVSAAYIPSSGFFPLSPFAGIAVLCGWSALAVGLATVLIRRRDV